MESADRERSKRSIDKRDGVGGGDGPGDDDLELGIGLYGNLFE